MVYSRFSACSFGFLHVTQAIYCVTLFVGALTLVSSARAQDASLEQKASAVLEKHCARCHQADKLVGREKPAKNFGNVIKMDEIARNPKLVLPGNPDGSRIFNVIAKQEMPYDLYQEGDMQQPSPSTTEIKTLRAWIDELGTKAANACKDRKFVSNEDVLQAIANDLKNQPRHRIADTRYITLTNIQNTCATDSEMNAYRQGVVKFLNSAGKSSDVVKIETTETEKSIVRINLNDLGWSRADWETLEAIYPYRSRPDDPLFAFVTGTTRTKLPYLRGDWLVFTAAQPPVYTQLLELPKTFRELQSKLNVNVEANIATLRAQRSGFQISGVSQHNRLIERHPISTGYFWTSYDFGGDRDRQDLKSYPLGPGSNGFQHDGGETIFSLPNGFQGYYLNRSDGVAIDKGPTNIVRDLSRRDLAVSNGISCMGCHDQGIKRASDEIRQHVLSDRSSFSRDIRDAVRELYPPVDVMTRQMDDDASRFRAAMVRAGLDPALKLNGMEPITALSSRYERPVDISNAAAELGLTSEELLAENAGTKAATLRRLRAGSMPRDQFETEFASLSGQLTDDVMVDGGPVLTTPVSTLAGGGRQRPAASPATAKDNDPNFEIALVADKVNYRVNDPIVLSVISPRDCALTLVNVNKSGQGTVIFPNKFQKDNRIIANSEFRFGDEGAPFRLRLSTRGTETVVAECSTSGSDPAFAGKQNTNGFTDIGNFSDRVSASATRSIVVDRSKPEPVSPVFQQKPVVRTSARTAIKIEVR